MGPPQDGARNRRFPPRFLKVSLWGWGFSENSDRLLIGGRPDVEVYSLPELQHLDTLAFEAPAPFWVRGNRLISIAGREDLRPSRRPIQISARLLDALDRPELVGQLPGDARFWQAELSSDGTRLSFVDGNEEGFYVLPLSRKRPDQRARLVGRHDGKPYRVGAIHPSGTWMATSGMEGEIRFWSLLARPGAMPTRIIEKGGVGWLKFTADGTRLIARDASLFDIWDLDAPFEADPISMRRDSEGAGGGDYVVHPSGDWLVATDVQSLSFWPIGGTYARVLRGLPPDRDELVWQMAFTPDGTGVLTTLLFEGVQLWPLSADGGQRRFVAENAGGPKFSAFDPTGRFIALGSWRTEEGTDVAVLVPAGGGPARVLPGSTQGEGQFRRVAFDLDGRRVALSHGGGAAHAKTIQVWDVETEDMQPFGPLENAADGLAGGTLDMAFAAGNRLVTVNPDGLRLWKLSDGSSEIIEPGDNWAYDSRLAASADGKRFAALGAPASGPRTTLKFIDLEASGVTSISSHGDRVSCVALSPDGSLIVTGDDDGVVKVGPQRVRLPTTSSATSGAFSPLPCPPTANSSLRWAKKEPSGSGRCPRASRSAPSRTTSF